MSKRLEIIFRVFSHHFIGRGYLGGILGLYLTATTIHVFPFVRTTLENKVVHPGKLNPEEAFLLIGEFWFVAAA